MVGNVFEQALAKTHEWIELWTSICSMYPILQQNCDLANEEVLRMNESCFRSVRMCGKCSQSSCKFVLTDMRGCLCFASFLLLEAREWKWCYSPVPALLSCCNFCSWLLELVDLILPQRSGPHASRIWFWHKVKLGKNGIVAFSF